MNRVTRVLIVLLSITVVALPALAATFEFHGDLNHRFNLYSNHAEFYSGAGSLEKGVANTKQVGKEGSNTTWGDIKYRLWTTAATNDGKVKGVYAIELGALRFGQQSKAGTGFSGDGVNIETRWAYTDLQLPNSDTARVKIGLQPFKVNSFVWNETAMGVVFNSALSDTKYQLAWMRGKEFFNSDDENQDSVDALSARFDLKPAEGTKLGLFVLFQHSNPTGAPGAVDAGGYEIKKLGDVDIDLYTLGVDGGTKAGDIFINWDALFQTGSIDNAAFTGLNGAATGDFDLSAFLLHGDVGINLGTTTVTFTSWYASGDDNENDQNFDAFIATDVDRFESVVLFEGGYTDDNYGTERPYILDKGLFLNKIAVDYKVNEKLQVGGAVLYLMTAEDIEYVDDNAAAQANSDIGVEIDAYGSYKLYENVELAINAGFLAAGDAMDAFEDDRDGSGEEDIYRITSRLRYKF